ENTTVYYQVQATDDGSVTAQSVELSYFIGNLPPSISAILLNPTAPNETQTVEVSATITDDGTIATAELKWSLDGITFDNTINMIVSTGDTYVTETQIPAQTVGTTVYYHIVATDNDAVSFSSDTLEYTTVLAPGSFVFQNGGFELWTGTTPDFWTTIDVGIEISEETTIIYEGAKSARINLITDAQANADIRQTVSVSAGHSYNFDVMVYQTDTFARARLFAGDFQGYSDPMILGEWQLISYNYFADIDADIEVGLRFYDRPGFTGSSIFYIDGFTMNDITNVNSLETNDLNIYPNPANNIINIEGKEVKSAEIFSITGQSVKIVSLLNNQVDISNLKQGMYILKINGTNSLRFIKE
ncbi:MAG: T9SS type A sorting domain-containing protein, partial [Bacteroidales bacterium]|nr:T9SS type A sorting domain-containing protein [Bacteroidales bacterium]